MARNPNKVGVWQSLRNAWKVQDIRKKLVYTFLMLVVFRLVGVIPAPGVDYARVQASMGSNTLPLLDLDDSRSFYQPHTYHLDIRFEMGFTQPHVLADAIIEALARGKRVLVEHFDLVYPLLHRNADLMIGVGEQIIISRPTIFGPEPVEFVNVVHSSLPYRLMAHTAEDLCEMHMSPELVNSCVHDDVHHGFVLAFREDHPEIDLAELERLVQADIAADLPVEYADENHIAVGGRVHECSGPRTHVSATGRIHGFRLYPKLVYDVQQNRYLLIGFVGEGSEEALRNFRDSLEGNPVRRSLAFF